MGTEVRRVKPDWKHPMSNGQPVPLHDGMTYQADVKQWDDWCEKFKKGLVPDPAYELREDRWVEHNREITTEAVVEYHGARPDVSDYGPQWSEEEATAYQFYETISEGTPISIVFLSRDAAIASYMLMMGCSEKTAEYTVDGKYK